MPSSELVRWLNTLRVFSRPVERDLVVDLVITPAWDESGDECPLEVIDSTGKWGLGLCISEQSVSIRVPLTLAGV